MLRIIATYLKAKCILRIIGAHLNKKKKKNMEVAKNQAEKVWMNVKKMKDFILTI